MLRRGLLVLVCLSIASLVAAGNAAAFWTSTGTGTGSASTGTLTAPVVSASATPTQSGTSAGSVKLSWTAATGTSAPISYYATRGTSPACGTSPSSTITALTCTDSGLAAGSYSYVVVAVSGNWSTASSPVAVTVTATEPAASALSFTKSPSSSKGGTAFTTQPVVTIQDSTGKTVTTDTSNVTLSIKSGTTGAVLSCTANPKAAVAGVATFSGCAIDKVGTYTLLATDGSLTSATSASFTITVGTATKLGFTASPSTALVNGAFYVQPVVAIQDAGGNTVTSNTSSVTLALSTPAGASLSCTANPKAASAGVASFTGCAVNKAGSYTLTATSGSLTRAVSATFTVLAASLVWTDYSTTVCSSSSGSPAALVFGGCVSLSGTGSFTSSVELVDSDGDELANPGADLTLGLTCTNGSLSSSTLTIPRGETSSTGSTTYRPAYAIRGPYTGVVTVTSGSATSAQATLNAF